MKLTRKQRERAARRELILDAAEDVISGKGFDNATMDEIAERAEVGKGTLYLYFKNKLAIYIAICERGSRRLNKKMAKVLTRDVTGIKMIEELGTAYMNFIVNNPRYFQAFNYYEGIVDEEILKNSPVAQQCRENGREAMTYIVRALQIGMQDGSIDRSYNPKELGAIIWGASKGIIQVAYIKQMNSCNEILEEMNFSAASLIQNFIRLISSGLTKN